MANARGPLPALTDTGVAKFPRLPEAKRMLSVPEHRSNDEEAQARSPFASKSLVSYSVIMNFMILSWITLALLAGALTSASAQGKVDFRNSGIDFATEADRNVYDLDGEGVYGSKWCVQLYYRAGANQGVDPQGVLTNATEVRGEPVRFRSTPSFRGWWAIPTGTSPYRELDGVSEGQTATLQVRAWDCSLFHTYDEAVAHSGITGRSAPFNYTAPPTNAPQNAFYMEGFRAFQLQPVEGGPALTIEVSKVRMCWESVLGATHQLQYRSELTGGRWLNLGEPMVGDGTTMCVEQPVDNPARFYRILTTR